MRKSVVIVAASALALAGCNEVEPEPAATYRTPAWEAAQAETSYQSPGWEVEQNWNQSLYAQQEALKQARTACADGDAAACSQAEIFRETIAETRNTKPGEPDGVSGE